MKNKISYLIATAAVAGLAQVASAVPVFPNPNVGNTGPIGDSSDSAGVYFYDTANGDSEYVALASSATTVATFNDANWDVVAALGDTISAGSNPVLDLDVDATSIGKGTVEVFYSVTGLGPTAAGYTFGITPSGSAPSNTTIGAYGGNSDAAFDLTHGLGASGTLTSSSVYSLTLEDSITGSVASLDTQLATVPDGGTTAMLLGAGLSGLALLKRKLVA